MRCLASLVWLCWQDLKRKKIEQIPGCEGGGEGVADQLEGNGPTTRVSRGPVSQYLPRHPESSPAQATNKQPDKLTDGQKVNVEELSSQE